MAVKSSLLSLVFTDLVDSTALKAQLGDHKAGELIERHQDRIRALRVETGGREVDTGVAQVIASLPDRLEEAQEASPRFASSLATRSACPVAPISV